MSKAWAFIQNEILGMQWLHRLTGDLLCALGLDVTDMGKVMTYGVMSMPAIVINEKVIAMGRILSVEEVKMALDKFI